MKYKLNTNELTLSTAVCWIDDRLISLVDKVLGGREDDSGTLVLEATR